jgi:hypothetical protein
MKLKLDNGSGRYIELGPSDEADKLDVVVRDEDVWAIMDIDKAQALQIAEFLKRWAES